MEKTNFAITALLNFITTFSFDTTMAKCITLSTQNMPSSRMPAIAKYPDILTAAATKQKKTFKN